MNKLIFALLLVSFTAHAEVFIEKSDDLNISFKHNDARSGDYHFTETAGSGVAWIDFNNDEKIDLLLINGTNGHHKLFENIGKSFKDVSKLLNSQISDDRTMGVCSADINQDGWVDFLITSYGLDRIYLNQQGKGFKSFNLDQKKLWSSSCAFSDLDNDGDLDLYVARYAVYHLNGNKTCQNSDSKGYCNPTAYQGETDGLYLNDGKGSFTEVSELRGIHMGGKDHSFGVLISDFDQDNDRDIYVANDGSNNRLYLNDGKGNFEDSGLMSGTAINLNGIAEASMGLALADINNDNKQDIIVSHFSMETNTIYLNFGDGFFSDSTQNFGINNSSYMSMGWGMALTDINNNGFEDLIVANGHIHEFSAKIDARQTYKQPNQVFINQSGKKYKVMPDQETFSPINHKSSRGLAMADWNNDGKIDLAINNINDSVDVYENVEKNQNNWAGIKLVGSKQNSSAIGAVVTMTIGDLSIRKEIMSGGSFQSQSDLRLIFGLGKNTEPVKIDIIWPNGKKDKHTIKNLNKYHTIKYSNKPN